MGSAALWGTVAASSLVIGAALALVRDWPVKLVSLVLAFGAGALISAVSFELAQDGAEVGGGLAVGIGLAVGALTYFGLDSLIEGRGGSDPASALALGAFLDGVPEQLVLGLGIAVGGEVGVGLIVAIFVSNLPEAIGSASKMRARRDGATIMRLWVAVAVVCALSTRRRLRARRQRERRAPGRRQRLRRRCAARDDHRLDDPRGTQGRAHRRAGDGPWLRRRRRPFGGVNAPLVRSG